MRKSKKEKRKMNDKRIIKKSILRIVVLLLILGLNWIGLLAVGRTFAYFNDTENSLENTYQAGTLDFSLNSPGDFSLNFTSEDPAVRNISVVSDGSLPFQYIIEGADFSGPLCDTLNLEAKLDEETKYDGSLIGFLLDPPIEISDSQDDWVFIFSFIGDVEQYKDTSCQFYFDFKGWQSDLPNYPDGFSDIERVFTHLMLRDEEIIVDEKIIVLNEFLPNPEGDECNLEGIEGEWVEIYNNSNQPMNLANWYIRDAALTTITITSSNTLGNSIIIGPKNSGTEWLVVFLNNCVLNNAGGDTVSLYNVSNELIDSYTYSGSVPEDKSYARYPDGTDPWYDPVPTPGGPNILVLDEEFTKQEESFIETIKSTGGEEISEEEEILAEGEEVVEESTEEDSSEEVSEEEAEEEEQSGGEEPGSEPSEENQPEQGGDSSSDEVSGGETPAVEEQPVAVPDNSSSDGGESGGGNSSDGGAGDAGGTGDAGDGGGDSSGSDSSGGAVPASDGGNTSE